MEQIVTGNQMKALDRFTINEIGIPSLVLMERAALAVCEAMEKADALKGRILFVCGGGNNGADGVAAARILSLRGYHADVYLLGNPEHFTEEMRHQIQIAEKYQVSFVKTCRYPEYTTIVDAIFGVGISRNVEGKYKEIIEQINACNRFVISVDIPSGVCADTGQVLGAGIRADLTVTFSYRKAGLCLYPGTLLAGKVHVAEIGIFRKECSLTGTEIFSCETADLKKISRVCDGNKGTFGKIFLIAGSKETFGAAYLSGLAALRTGAGMLKICTRKENRPLFSCFPEAMLLTYDDESDLESLVKEGLAWADTAGIGPGIGTGEQSERLLKILLEECRCPLVLDADALNLLAEKKHLLAACKAQTVLTPHLGEFARLTGISPSQWKRDPLEITKAQAGELSSVLICKDARSVISEGTSCWVNRSGNDGMATAGSGDVLTGILLGLLAQKLPVKEAAVYGTYLHGLAGDQAAGKKGKAGMLAGDIIDGLTEVLQQLVRKEGEL